MSSIKLSIPHRLESDPSCHLVGILERPNGNKESAQANKPLALILHGAMGHKDYLFQRKLAPLLPMDSFRFDFRGNHESGGTWSVARITGDVIDIQVVAEYMKQHYGYNVTLVIGHSRGSFTACKWVCSGTEETSTVRMFINVSGRYRMEAYRGLMGHYEDEIRRRGYGEWKVKVAGKEVVGRIYPEDIEEFATWDNTYIEKSFPNGVHTLSIHGLSDAMVPPYDAVLYTQAFGSGNKHTGLHTLHYVEGADHNYTGMHEAVNITIVDWVKQMQHGVRLPASYLWQRKSRL